MSNGALRENENKYEENAYLNNYDYLCDQLAYMEMVIKDYISENYSAPSYKETEQLNQWILSTEKIDILKSKRDKLLNSIKLKIESSVKNNLYLPLEYLSWTFNLTDFEKLCVILCFAVEVDERYGSLFGYFQNSISQNKPWIGLLLQIFCGTQFERFKAIRFFGTDSIFLRYILHIENNPSYTYTPLALQTIKLRSRIFEYILGMDTIGSMIKPASKFYTPDGKFYSFSNSQGVYKKMQEILDLYTSKNFKSGQSIIFYLYGPSGSGKKTHAGKICSYIKVPMLVIDVERLKGCKPSLEEIVEQIDTELFLSQAVLCIENFDSILDDENHEFYLKILNDLVLRNSRLTFITGKKSWKPEAAAEQHIFIDICFKGLLEPERKSIWEVLGSYYAFEDGINLSHFACKFNFTPGQISEVLIKAKNNSLWEKAEIGKITYENLIAACHAQSGGKLDTVAQKIESKYTWDDIILPIDQKIQLKEICNQVKYRSVVFGDWGFDQKLSRGKGLNVLFSGPSGTGKTMAAEVVSKELGLELYRIELSQVVSKYIGETEKNMRYIFDEAYKSNAILFFDEADALFGKRTEVKDSHDRHANIETSYLLQKMEEYTGVTILATNFRGNIDEAFSRRMSFCLEFVLPDEESRRKIWESMFTDKVPRSTDINLEFLAKEFKITGGNIKNIILTAAFYGAEDSSEISMSHIIRAIKREYQKIGKLCTKSDFDKYYKYANQQISGAAIHTAHGGY